VLEFKKVNFDQKTNLIRKIQWKKNNSNKKPFNISSEVEWLDLKNLIAEYANKRPHICSMVHKLKQIKITLS